MLDAAIAGGASLAGGYMANRQSAANAQQNNQFNAMMQLQNQQWQTQMSNTAYQRASADMKEAGLNPAMMYGGGGHGGASTPGGGAASGSMAQVSDYLGPAVERAIGALRLTNETELNKAVVAKTTADAATSAAQAENLHAEAANKRSIAPYVAGEVVARMGNLKSSAAQAEATSRNLGAVLPKLQEEATMSKLEREEKEAVGPNTVSRSLYRTAATAAKAAAEGLVQIMPSSATAHARVIPHLYPKFSPLIPKGGLRGGVHR